MDSPFILWMLVSLTLLHVNGIVGGATLDPTYGFVSIPINGSHVEIQRPYNLSKGSRYSFTNGVHKLWVLSSDKPHSPASHTTPLSEIRIQGYEYLDGVWQFEGHIYVPSGTSGVCVMQIFDVEHNAPALMLTVYNGALMYYKSHVLAYDIYGKWLKMNVIHDAKAQRIKVFIDNDMKLVTNDHGRSTHYFKFGVSTHRGSSYFAESRWKEIKVLMKLSD